MVSYAAQLDFAKLGNPQIVFTQVILAKRRGGDLLGQSSNLWMNFSKLISQAGPPSREPNRPVYSAVHEAMNSAGLAEWRANRWRCSPREIGSRAYPEDAQRVLQPISCNLLDRFQRKVQA